MEILFKILSSGNCILVVSEGTHYSRRMALPSTLMGVSGRKLDIVVHRSKVKIPSC